MHKIKFSYRTWYSCRPFQARDHHDR